MPKVFKSTGLKSVCENSFGVQRENSEGEDNGCTKKISVILSGSEEPVLEGNCSVALKVRENQTVLRTNLRRAVVFSALSANSAVN